MKPPLFERVMFATLVPALALPIAMATLALWVQPGPDSSDPLDEYVGFLILGVFHMVLLGSMCLNAWLLVRRPVNLEYRSVPRTPGYALVVLYFTVTLWIASIFILPLTAGAFWFFAPAVMIESIVVCVLIGTSRRPSSAKFAEGLASGARWGVAVYLIVAIVAVVTGIQLMSRPPSNDWLAYWVPVITALGVPWSPVVVLGDFYWLMTGYFWYPYTPPTTLLYQPPVKPQVHPELVILMLPAIINIVLAAGILASRQSRAVALRLLFFRGTERPAKD